jgi:hypothetical protein
MVTLGRAIRIKDMILLPNGERIRVNVDVEANLLPLNAALCKCTAAAQDYVNSPQGEAERTAFYQAFADYVKAALGAANYEKALAAYDGEAEELCNQLDAWMGEEVAPRIAEASHKRLRMLQAKARKHRK